VGIQSHSDVVDAFLRGEPAAGGDLEVELRPVRNGSPVAVLWSREQLLAALLPEGVAVNRSAPATTDRRLVLSVANGAGLHVELLGERQLWRRLSGRRQE